jgi:hypothetical protein
MFDEIRRQGGYKFADGLVRIDAEATVTASSTKQQKVLIVGGGPVGALAALSFLKRGWQVELWEARSGGSSSRLRKPFGYAKGFGLLSLWVHGQIQGMMMSLRPISDRSTSLYPHVAFRPCDRSTLILVGRMIGLLMVTELTHPMM